MIWFNITLIDCNGMNLAMWAYDQRFPVIPPRFTYINDSEACPYRLAFSRVTREEVTLAPAIDDAIQLYRNNIPL